MRVAIERTRMLKVVRPKRSILIRNGPPRRPGNDVKNFASFALAELVALTAIGLLRIWHERPQSVLPLEAFSGPSFSVAIQRPPALPNQNFRNHAYAYACGNCLRPLFSR